MSSDLASARSPLDLAQRRAETLQLVAAFLYARAAPADGASPEAAAAALRGMLRRVQIACSHSVECEALARRMRGDSETADSVDDGGGGVNGGGSVNDSVDDGGGGADSGGGANDSNLGANDDGGGVHDGGGVNDGGGGVFTGATSPAIAPDGMLHRRVVHTSAVVLTTAPDGIRTDASVAKCGVYRPRRGRVGSGLSKFGEAERRQLAAVAGAELCLFKYEADPNSKFFGRPLAGPPHAIYLDPQSGSADAAAAAATATAANANASAAAVGTSGAGAGAAGGGASMRAVLSVLNRGQGLRPREDARGMRWRDGLVLKRDASLIFASESHVAHVEPCDDAEEGVGGYGSFALTNHGDDETRR